MYKAGDIVEFCNEELHERCPMCYPPAGTVGVLTGKGETFPRGELWDVCWLEETFQVCTDSVKPYTKGENLVVPGKWAESLAKYATATRK